MTDWGKKVYDLFFQALSQTPSGNSLASRIVRTFNQLEKGGHVREAIDDIDTASGASEDNTKYLYTTADATSANMVTDSYFARTWAVDGAEGDYNDNTMSLEALNIDTDNLITQSNYLPKTMGNIYYVTKSGSDGNSGTAPDTSFLTIGAAITAAIAGDCIRVAAGTYDENGLNLNLAGMCLMGEMGTIIINTNPGTCLTISGNSCSVQGIKVSQAGQIGFAITGSVCFIDHCISEDNTIGFDIDGSNNIIRFSQDDNATTTGFDIAGAENLLYLCKTIASGGASRGFYLSNAAADRNLIYQCTSLANGTAGYETVTGTQYNVFAYCTSGSSDGIRVDNGTDNAWPAYTFDSEVYHETDWSAVGGGAGTENIFKITGSVNIVYVYGDVETQLHADVDNLYLELDDGVNQINVTGKVAGGTDTNSAGVGSLFIKTETAANNMALLQADEVRFNEDSAGKKGGAGFIVTQKNGANTYIRVGWTGAGATGVIHWHCQYEPLTESGYVETYVAP